LSDELNSDPSETIAAADFIISAAFTSPTIEALGSRKKAIYYSPNEKFRGYYYDRIPRMVSHSYPELKENVNYWMNEITPDDYELFLTTFILGDLDKYLDGHAISRFRKKLCT